MPPRSLTKTTRLAGLGIPRGRGAGAVGEGKALGGAAVGVGDEEFRIAEHGGREHELASRRATTPGELLVPRKRGKVMTLLASTEYMQICGLTTPWDGAKQVKAMREASGDQRGVSEMVLSEVSGC